MALKRILEPEVMETEKDAVEYDSMDFTEVNMAFAVRALELAPSSGRVLDIGTGTARIPVLMLQQGGIDLLVYAMDLSMEMIKIGRRNVELARLTNRIKLNYGDAKDLPFFSNEFDMVISNSLAHHLPDPLVFFMEVGRLVKHGGAICIRDLMRPASVSQINHLVQKYAGDADEHQRKLYRDSLYASLTLSEVEALVKKAHIPGAKVVQSSDRHWTVERPYAG